MYCKNCGTKIPDGSVFCMKCGADLNDAQTSIEDFTVPIQNESQTTREKCTKCGSRNLQALTGDTTIFKTSESNLPVGKSCLRYWICKDCGNKFKDLSTLKAEIEQKEKQIFILRIALAIAIPIFFILFMISFLNSGPKEAIKMVVPPVVLVGIMGIIFICKIWQELQGARKEYEKTERIFMSE